MFVVSALQAYTSQFVALIMFGLMMSEDRLSLQNRRLEIINGLKVLPGQYVGKLQSPSVFKRVNPPPLWCLFEDVYLIHSSSKLTELIKKVLALDEKIKTIANELYQQRSLLVMGRGYNYATCLEGALVSLMFVFNLLFSTGISRNVS